MKDASGKQCGCWGGLEDAPCPMHGASTGGVQACGGDVPDVATWHCDVCNEEHPVLPAVTSCWVRDGRRLEALEAAVKRIEAKVMEVRPTPPGVSPPMGTHPAVGVATVDGKATCPKCPESVESRATYARVPAHASQTGPLVPSEGQCAYPIGGDIVCRLPPGHGGAHGMLWASPAEAAICERGGYVLSDAAESSRLVHVGTGCWCKLGEACPDLMRQRAEANRRKAAARENMDRRIKDATRAMEQRNAEEMNLPRPAGGMVGLDAMLPPISDIVTPKNKALMEKWGVQFVGDSAMDKALEKHGAALEEAGRGTTPAAILGPALDMLQRIADGRYDGTSDEIRAFIMRATREAEAPTPAAMLGEAVALLALVGDMVQKAGDLDRHIIATIDELRTYIEEAKVKRDAEAQESER